MGELIVHSEHLPFLRYHLCATMKSSSVCDNHIPDFAFKMKNSILTILPLNLLICPSIFSVPTIKSLIVAAVYIGKWPRFNGNLIKLKKHESGVGMRTTMTMKIIFVCQCSLQETRLLEGSPASSK